jgi:hypothetical protein
MLTAADTPAIRIPDTAPAAQPGTQNTTSPRRRAKEAGSEPAREERIRRHKPAKTLEKPNEIAPSPECTA